MKRTVRLAALGLVLALGFSTAATVASGLGVDTTETTTAATTTTTPSRTAGVTIAPTTTVVTTATVEQTTTRLVTIPSSETTTSTSSSADTAAWIWVLLGILAVGLIVLIVLLARRGDSHKPAPVVDDRRRQLDAVISSWIGQGWAIESHTAESAVLRRGAETMVVDVDQSGHVSARPLGSM
jgi:hypothetical protein